MNTPYTIKRLNTVRPLCRHNKKRITRLFIFRQTCSSSSNHIDNNSIIIKTITDGIFEEKNIRAMSDNPAAVTGGSDRAPSALSVLLLSTSVSVPCVGVFNSNKSFCSSFSQRMESSRRLAC